jgi:hypothetical protein
MHAELLARIGAALYGEQWQSDLARALGVNARTMRRWAVDGAPERIAPELLALVTARGAELASVAAALMPPPMR